MMMIIYIALLIGIVWLVLSKTIGPARGGGCCGSACESSHEDRKG